jgi:hypothetical protein
MESEQDTLFSIPISEIQPALRKLDTAVKVETTQLVYNYHLNKWKSHPQYTSSCSMARHLIEDIHEYFRSGFKLLIKTGTVDLGGFNSLNSFLHHHHGIEDSYFFPKMIREHPHLEEEFKILENDHVTLKELEDEIKNSNFNALDTFVTLLLDHLNREELLLVPLMLK